MASSASIARRMVSTEECHYRKTSGLNVVELMRPGIFMLPGVLRDSAFSDGGAFFELFIEEPVMMA